MPRRLKIFWKPFPLNPRYLVRGDGGGILGPYRKPLKACRLKRGGYLAVNIYLGGKRKLWRVNRIVCWTFHGPPPSRRHEAAHSDGDKLNNSPRNLSWKTRLENMRDRICHGTSNQGSTNAFAKLTESKVRTIKRLLKGEKICVIAARFKVASSIISGIKNGDRWKHVA